MSGDHNSKPNSSELKEKWVWKKTIFLSNILLNFWFNKNIWFKNWVKNLTQHLVFKLYSNHNPLSKVMCQRHGNTVQMIIMYQCLWILYGDPFDSPNVRVNKATISIIISLLSDEVTTKPAYRVRYYCKNNLRKLPRQSKFLYLLYISFDWTKIGITWRVWCMNMGYNLVLLPPNCVETNRK